MQNGTWKEIPAESLQMNPFTLIGQEWMLVTAGDASAHNSLTASWGGLGVIWRQNVSYIFIRPQRYTLQFLEENDHYALSFFEEDYKKVLGYYGSHSGRDVDKDKETGLTAVFDEAAPYYQQAKMVLICKKMAEQIIEPSALADPAMDAEFYPDKDYHRMFVGAIEKVLVKE